MGYAELQAISAFSFLQGASRPDELVRTAHALGHTAIGIADHNSVAGIVRAHEAASECGIRLLAGAKLVFHDGTPDVLCYPRDRAAWGRLTGLLTLGKSRGARINGRPCLLDRADLAQLAKDQLLIVTAPSSLSQDFGRRLGSLALDNPGRVWLAASRRQRADDMVRLRRLSALSRQVKAPMVAVNDVLYHEPSRRMLHDVLGCVRLGCTIEKAGRRLQPNAERYLKPGNEMQRLFRTHPEAIASIEAIAEQVRFSLNDLTYQYPDEPVAHGSTPDTYLRQLAQSGAKQRYPGGVPLNVAQRLEQELQLVSTLDYARYFLTVYDITRFAHEQGILCQGRGSAANSVLCFCLSVTAVDPEDSELLFERFLSPERREPPDIDIDFEHDRREEIIQYIYQRYGHHRAAIAATVIHFRPKLAIREVGKALGLSQDATAALSAQSWNSEDDLWSDARLAETGLDSDSHRLKQATKLAQELVGLPRHLSQHVGGFVLTQGRLDETVPIVPAAMNDRFHIEWDKDDIDRLGIMKVDILALGMLSCISKCFELISQHDHQIASFNDVPRADPDVYEMLGRGDSLGVFQVESRAQMNMLPRLRPRCFYDLVIEVAIVRPGPIQGDMVHPYLRRRHAAEVVDSAAPNSDRGLRHELENVLSRTMGVPLFQEQAMKIAIDAARFTPDEANGLRRAMATFRHVGTIQNFEDKMVKGMVERGYDRAFAQRCFQQIKGFGTYGFPESHAASFAHLVYVSSWLKCRHPAAFACALLNSQPMGFYAPAQIVRDAREHGVAVEPIDIKDSHWDCTLSGRVVQLGFRLIGGFRQDWVDIIVRARPCSMEELSNLSLPQTALTLLAEADALRSVGLERQHASWCVRGLDARADLPLLPPMPATAANATLPPVSASQQIIADYRSVQFSLSGHPMQYLRQSMAQNGIMSCAAVAAAANGRKVRVAGVVLVRQRPGSANGVIFATLEDETGVANVVIWPSLQERFRSEIVGATLLEVDGTMQRSPEGIVHVVADLLCDRSAELRALSEIAASPPLARGDELRKARHLPRAPGHPRHAQPIPRSRDFH